MTTAAHLQPETYVPMAERELVGAFLEYGSEAVEQLPRDFDVADIRDPKLRVIAQHVVDLQRRSVPISIVVVADALDQGTAPNGAPWLRWCGGLAELFQLREDAAVSHLLVPHYARILQRHVEIQRRKGGA